MNNQENKEWKEKFREYFDKHLKSKQIGIKYLDREVIIAFIESLLTSESDRVKKVINDEIQKKREHKLHLMESGGGIFEGTQTNFSINVLTDLLTTLYPKE